MSEEKKVLTSKEMKKLVKPEFAKNFEKVYPVATLRKLGFSRYTCACGHNYWAASDARKTCGDSNCEKMYKFIGVGTGCGKAGKKITYAEAWNGFKKSLTSARVPCTAIPRYPVVARWRTDVEFVNAGIYCFQPYCVTGELDPPANPLICPQFCVRFNDLDNIGLTGRHYSGFIMLGIQVFNKPNARKFWMEECVEFNYRWLTEELKIDPAEITFIEDVWAGGGNLGPSIEYFVGGLELGNMVFMQYKTFPDGSRKPLDVQVIDVGIGLERIPWLINGTPTSYIDIFPSALKLFNSKINMSDSHSKVWEKFGPYSCLLNVDEIDDIDKTWGEIAEKVGMPAKEVQAAIQQVRDMYIVLDHTRSILMTVSDGMLPSNTGGGSDIRNLLRRVFSILEKRKWWEPLGKLDGFLQLFECHRTDLATIYGPFAAFPSFTDIIKLEYDRYMNTQTAQKEQCKKMLQKKKGKQFELADWMLCVSSFGMSIDLIQSVTNQPAPGDLYMRIAEEQERSAKQAAPQVYDCATLKPTESLFYKNDQLFEFEGSIVKVLEYHKRAAHKKPKDDDEEEEELGVEGPTIVVLDQSSFYPTSGGQDHDTGLMWVESKEYKVVDVQKVGPCVLHFLDAPLPVANLSHYVNMKVKGKVNEERRKQLRIHHSATHIMYASCRQVLGPHVWQHGAKKQLDMAHLDVTHYDSINLKQRLAIEDMANKLVQSSKPIKKWYMPKEEAEKKFGFSLYQGGVVPGSQLRIVQIADTDTEACCGTHCDNTSEVGYIKIIKAQRVSDGVLRVYFCAGAPALKLKSEDMTVLYSMCEEFNVPPSMLTDTVHRFFDGFKKNESSKASQEILLLTMKCLLLDEKTNAILIKSDAKDATECISLLPQFAKDLKSKNKSVVVVGESFVYGILPRVVDIKKDLEPLMKTGDDEKKPAKFKVDNKIKSSSSTVTDVTSVVVFNAKNPAEVVKYFVEQHHCKLSDY